MNLTFHPKKGGSPAYWYAETDDGGHDGDGATPLDAVCALVAQMEDTDD